MSLDNLPFIIQEIGLQGLTKILQEPKPSTFLAFGLILFTAKGLHKRRLP